MLVLGGGGGGKQENPDKTLLSGTKISDKPDPLTLSGPGFARGPYFRCPKRYTFCYFIPV